MQSRLINTRRRQAFEAGAPPERQRRLLEFKAEAEASIQSLERMLETLRTEYIEFRERIEARTLPANVSVTPTPEHDAARGHYLLAAVASIIGEFCLAGVQAIANEVNPLWWIAAAGLLAIITLGILRKFYYAEYQRRAPEAAASRISRGPLLISAFGTAAAVVLFALARAVPSVAPSVTTLDASLAIGSLACIVLAASFHLLSFIYGTPRRLARSFELFEAELVATRAYADTLEKIPADLSVDRLAAAPAHVPAELEV